MKRYVVLLRGINLGPRNRLKMADFREALEEARFENVQTLAQSGNAVVSDRGSASDAEKSVRKVLASKFGLDVDVIVRTAAALRKIVADDPLGKVATDGKLHFVVFCSSKHDSKLLPEVVPPEQLVARPLEIHTWCPKGVRDGKLMNTLGRKPPAPVTTFRNWNTVAKLVEMLDG